MSSLLNKLGFLSYENYLFKFENWVKNGESSLLNASSSIIEFTKLNWHRTQRLQKTISINEELIEIILNISDSYSWIVVTEAWCGDSAQILPLIAAIANMNPRKIKLYILLRDENPELIDNYLTNGARAIPKLIVINEVTSKEEFVWGPRPIPAQIMFNEWKQNPKGKSWNDFEKDLHGWYAMDKTQTIQQEFLSYFKTLNKFSKTVI